VVLVLNSKTAIPFKKRWGAELHLEGLDTTDGYTTKSLKYSQCDDRLLFIFSAQDYTSWWQRHCVNELVSHQSGSAVQHSNYYTSMPCLGSRVRQYYFFCCLLSASDHPHITVNATYFNSNLLLKINYNTNSFPFTVAQILSFFTRLFSFIIQFRQSSL